MLESRRRTPLLKKWWTKTGLLTGSGTIGLYPTEQSGKHPQLVVYEGEMRRPAILRFSTTVLLIMLTII
jgi:hypothetical protein